MHNIKIAAMQYMQFQLKLIAHIAKIMFIRIVYIYIYI